MKRLILAGLFLLLPAAAFAADNAVVVTPGSGVTMRSKDIGSGVQSMVHILGDASGNPTQCPNHVLVHGVASATNTLVVQGVTSQTIRICGAFFSFSGSAAQAAFLENTASVNANCSSTNTQITGTITGVVSTNLVPSQAGWYSPWYSGLSNTVSNGLCVNTSGTGGFDLDVWYAQF